MKIAFVGKGGSGKTTVTALFARWLAHNGKKVVAFDADINQHLFQALGGSGQPPRSLYAQLPEIKKYLRGTNPRIASIDVMVKTTPPGAGSRLLSADATQDALLKQITAPVNGVAMAPAGELEQSDLGVKCFHSKSGVIELLLSHIVDAPDEFVLVDLTAGADPFASSILGKVDLVCLVVEPNLPSAGVYEQFKRYTEDWVAPLVVLGNKIADAEDAAWLQHKVGEDVLAALPVSQFVKQESRGAVLPVAQLEPEVTASFTALLHKARSFRRDWHAYVTRGNYLHAKNAEAWANASTGADLLAQIDPDFAYPSS